MKRKENIIEQIRRCVLKEKKPSFFFNVYIYLKDSNKEKFKYNYDLFYREFLYNVELAKLIDELFYTYSFKKAKAEMMKIYDELLNEIFNDPKANYSLLSQLTYIVDEKFLLDLLNSNPTRRTKFCYLYKELSRIFIDDIYEEIKNEEFDKALEDYKKYASKPEFCIVNCLQNRDPYIGRSLINVLKCSV